jgi:hypothetical protein
MNKKNSFTITPGKRAPIQELQVQPLTGPPPTELVDWLIGKTEKQMKTKILAGSKGVYVPPKPLVGGGSVELEVTHDTDIDSSSFPVKFEGAAAGCYISKERIKFSDDAKCEKY